MNGSNHLNEIVSIINKSESILLATHIFPDGDALGSLLGLGDILTSMGKKVIMYGEEPVSYLYDFMPNCRKITTSLPLTNNVDCAVALDCGDQARLGKAMDDLLKIKPFVVIDHHTGHKEFGDVRWVAPDMPSTGNMVYHLAEQLGIELSSSAAYCLYTAIVSDTGSFKYASTTADTFHIAGKLVANGVNPEDVAGKLFDNFTKNRLQLLQLVLASMELLADGQIALITASTEMFAQTGATPRDTETFINYPRSLATVKMAAFIKQTNGTISVSLRSKGKYNVAEIAQKFNGGGHRNAAGFKVYENPNLEKIRQKIIDLLLPIVEK